MSSTRQKREGLVRHIGVSNFTSQHLRELMEETDYGIKGVFIQMEIHPWYWRDALEIQNCFAGQGLVIVGNALPAKNLHEITERTKRGGVQVVLAWALSKKWGILVRSENMEHLRRNLGASSLRGLLTAEDYAAIDSISSIGKEILCFDPRLVK
jgi:diketogulonate reductase-like aldo/keto reductase